MSKYNENEVTFKQIILKHILEISKFSSCEFRGGYWEIKPDLRNNVGIDYKVYIPDSREVYSNAVDCLSDMLYPHFDKTMIEAEKQIREELKKVLKSNSTYIEPSHEEKTGVIEDYQFRFETEDKRIAYRTARVQIMRKLFRALCVFMRNANLNILEFLDSSHSEDRIG
jgi:hypothetical protein